MSDWRWVSLCYTHPTALENAYSEGYRAELNRVGGMWFSLPADDPKWRYIADGREVWLHENGVLVEVYRITRRRTARE